MNHLIVYAHPSSDSFSNKIMTAVKELSTESGYKTEIRDLYSIGFDPVLKASDLKGIHNGKIPEDIKREKNYIEWAEIITIIYPIWWTGMPAVLKGYIDRVFSFCMAYKHGNKGRGGILKGKIVFLLSPMETSNEDYGKNGMLDAMKLTCDEGIFKFCGMKVVKHVFFGSLSTVGEEMIQEYVKAIPKVFSKGLPARKNNGESNKKNQSKQEYESNEGNEDNKHSESSKDNGRKKDNKSREEGDEQNRKNSQRNYSTNNLDSNENNHSGNDGSGEKENNNESKSNSSKKGNEKNRDKDE